MSHQEMLAAMLSLDPADRPTCEKVLVDYRNTIFPDYFYTFLQDYVNDLYTKSESESNGAGTQDPTVRFANKADEIVEAIADDWSGIISAVVQEHRFTIGDNDGNVANDAKVADSSQCHALPISSIHSISKLCSRAKHAAPEHPRLEHAELSSCILSRQIVRTSSPDGGSDTRRRSH